MTKLSKGFRGFDPESDPYQPISTGLGKKADTFKPGESPGRALRTAIKKNQRVERKYENEISKIDPKKIDPHIALADLVRRYLGDIQRKGPIKASLACSVPSTGRVSLRASQLVIGDERLMISHGRRTEVQYSDKVHIHSGGFVSTGRSVSDFWVEALPGTAFDIHDVDVAEALERLGNIPMLSIEVRDTYTDQSRGLRKEREVLLERLAEVEALIEAQESQVESALVGMRFGSQ